MVFDKLNVKINSIKSSITQLEGEIEKLNEPPMEEIITNGDDWDLVDERTGESFLKINPAKTELTRLGCAYLLMEICEYLNEKQNQARKERRFH